MIAFMILSVALLDRGHAFIKNQLLMHSTFGAGGAAAHAKAFQQQLDKHAAEVQDEQQRTASASLIASITPVEHQVQVHSFTFPLPSAFIALPNSACLIPCL